MARCPYRSGGDPALSRGRRAGRALALRVASRDAEAGNARASEGPRHRPADIGDLERERSECDDRPGLRALQDDRRARAAQPDAYLQPLRPLHLSRASRRIQPAAAWLARDELTV